MLSREECLHCACFPITCTRVYCFLSATGVLLEFLDCVLCASLSAILRLVAELEFDQCQPLLLLTLLMTPAVPADPAEEHECLPDDEDGELAEVEGC